MCKCRGRLNVYVVIAYYIDAVYAVGLHLVNNAALVISNKVADARLVGGHTN